LNATVRKSKRRREGNYFERVIASRGGRKVLG